MKKTLIFSLFFICIGYSGFSQQKNQLFEMINETFIRFIEFEKERCEKRGKEANFNGYYISLEHLPLGFSFSEEISKQPFQYLYVPCKGSKKVLKKNKTVLYLDGPLINGDEMEFIIPFKTVSRKKNTISISTGTFWFSCKWKYSVEDNKWKFISEEVGGI